MTKTGAFGNAIETYPVVPGSVWSVGPHRFMCGSSVDYHKAGSLLAVLGPADLVYTDPPWNAGNRAMFHGYAGLPRPDEDFDVFLAGIVELLVTMCPLGRIGLEMGVRAFPGLQAMLERGGGKTGSVITTTYGHPPRPLKVWFGTFGPELFQVETDRPLHGQEALRFGLAVVGAGPGKVYLDPFCGNMNFGYEAALTGATVHGCELIPAKLAQGLQRMAKLGHTPERIF